MVNEFQGMKLLILGGMRISCEIIHKAKSMGIYTIVADYNKIEDNSIRFATYIKHDFIRLNCNNSSVYNFTCADFLPFFVI